MDQIDDILSWSPVFSVFVASLLGSVHCAGMCGVVLLSVSANKRRDVFLYHLSRGATYVTLGACFGGFSHILYFDFAYGVLKFFFSIGFALYLIWLGVELIWFGRSVSLSFVYRKLGLEEWSRKCLSSEFNNKSSFKASWIGVMTGFLPCGWLISFLGLSLATKSISKGALVMVVFWAGTIPWMEALRWGRGHLVQRNWFRERQMLWVRNGIAFVLILNGAYGIFRHCKTSDHPVISVGKNVLCISP